MRARQWLGRSPCPPSRHPEGKVLSTAKLLIGSDRAHPASSGSGQVEDRSAQWPSASSQIPLSARVAITDARRAERDRRVLVPAQIRKHWPPGMSAFAEKTRPKRCRSSNAGSVASSTTRATKCPDTRIPWRCSWARMHSAPRSCWRPTSARGLRNRLKLRQAACRLIAGDTGRPGLTMTPLPASARPPVAPLSRLVGSSPAMLQVGRAGVLAP